MLDDYLASQGFEDENDFLPLMTMDEDEGEPGAGESYNKALPVIALKNTVLFPGVVIPITVGRDHSINAINQAHQTDKFVAVIAQKEQKIEQPTQEDLYSIGTVAKILKLLKMPDGTTTAILQGRKRFRLLSLVDNGNLYSGEIEVIGYETVEEELEFEALMASVMDQAQRIIELSPHIPSEAAVMLKNINNKVSLLNFIASNIGNKVATKQGILEIDNLTNAARKVLEEMNNELQLLELKDQIENKVRGDLEKQQRDYFLNQQLKTIQEELGQNPQEEEILKLVEKAREKKWPESIDDTFQKSITRLKRINPQMAEYSILLNYLELVLDLPWSDYSEDNFNLNNAKEVLDRDHFGLDKVKERILEHLAVLKLKGDMKAPILCLVGPPGVGKTSLGKSIASALGREYIRMSLGGLHDESEIRGHRKTYIGAMPGRIIQSIKRAGTSNPVFILDEIDKVGKDFRGDPSSALLEVLDPEQNDAFYDNYLELEYDLSKVLFIATANALNSIQPALLDRMELIQISGYSQEEKVEIAQRHLIPKQREEHGINEDQIVLPPETINKIAREYTRESGVRSLNRQIGGVMRSIAKKVAMEETYDPLVRPEQLNDILGPAHYSSETYQTVDAPGVAIGLAWTAVGGDILFIESSLSTGKGKLILTGNLGDVMKESATTALSFIKAHADELGIDNAIFNEKDVHIHIPEGAIPKDGPSAGITMLSALSSVFTDKKIKPYLAMTGEITLRGKVLPVGGIKEKLLAARRAGMKEVILCHENKKHVDEINPVYLEGLSFHYVRRMAEVLDIAICNN